MDIFQTMMVVGNLDGDERENSRYQIILVIKQFNCNLRYILGVINIKEYLLNCHPFLLHIVKGTKMVKRDIVKEIGGK